MPTRVRGAAMTGPGAIEVREFPYPRPEEPGALLLRIVLAGICGTDKHTFKGENVQYAGPEAQSTTPFPIIPGHENLGVVAELGPDGGRQRDFYGRDLKKGDRLVMCPDVVCGRCWYCRQVHGYPWCENLRGYGNAFPTSEPPSLFGGWAEYMYILPNTFVYLVPPSIPDEIAVLAEPFAVAYALDEASESGSALGGGFAAGDTVVVQGVGPLGLCCVVKARLLGAGEIVATDLSDFRLAMARDFSADHALSVRQTERQERIDYVRQLTQGRGADLVVGCTNDSGAFTEGLEMLRKGGTYIELGNFVDTGPTTINVHRHVVAKIARIIGVTNHPFTKYDASLKVLDKYRGQFPFARMVTHRYPLAQAEAAMRKSLDEDSLKVVIDPWAERPGSGED